MFTILWQVCDSELFPVSIFEVDSVEHQPIDPQKNNGIEPLQGINITERYTNYCIDRYQNYRSQMYRGLIWNSDYHEAYLSNIFR